MAQAIWSGTISFGLVNVPVKLYPATRRKDVRFHELDRLTGQRVRHQRVRLPEIATAPFPFETFPMDRLEHLEPASPVPAPNNRAPAPQREVAAEEVVKGFEVAPDQYVTVSADELASLAPERSRVIEVEQFASITAIDPIHFETSYYVVPVRESARAFALLVEAMAETGRLAISWITLRRKRHLAAIRPYGSLMLLSTMLHSGEILPAADFEPSASFELTAKERQMAQLLVDTLSGPFEAERYRDEYRERLLELLQGKAPTPAPEVAPIATGQHVQDLMAALRASIEIARKERGERAPKPQRRRGKSA